MKRLVLVIFSICIMLVVPTFACTGFYVGKEVSDNGTTIIARTRDSNNMQKATRRVFNKRIENKKILEAEPFVKTGISEACIGDIVAMCCKTGREAVEFLRQDYRIKI